MGSLLLFWVCADAVPILPAELHSCRDAPHLSWGIRLFSDLLLLLSVSISQEPESVLSLSLLEDCPYCGPPQ